MTSTYHFTTRLTFATIVLSGLLCWRSALAQDDTRAAASAVPAWHLQAELGTDVPLMAGFRVVTETPQRVRLGLSLGIAPAAYMSMANGFLSGIDAYDNNATGEVLEEALSGSFALRLHVGWRPVSDLGLYFVVGYSLAAAGGGVANEDQLESASGIGPPRTTIGAGRAYDVGSTLHLFDFEVGYEWLFEPATIRLGLGFTGSLSASSDVDARFEARDPAAQAEFESGVATYLDEALEGHFYLPLLSFSVGYRFF